MSSWFCQRRDSLLLWSTDRYGSPLFVEEEGRGSVDLGAGDGVEWLEWFEPVAYGYAG